MDYKTRLEIVRWCLLLTRSAGFSLTLEFGHEFRLSRCGLLKVVVVVFDLVRDVCSCTKC